jgi:hypothetical protein
MKTPLRHLGVVGVREPLVELETLIVGWRWTSVLTRPGQLTVGNLGAKHDGYVQVLYSFVIHKCDSHILQYHLECLALEQAPTRWICEACEASGPA